MSRFVTRRFGALLFAMGLVLLGLASAGGASVDRVQAQGGAETRPCSPVFERTVKPLKTEQGGTLDVEVKFDYDCKQRASDTIINVMLVVADNVPEDFNRTATLERNLRAGLSTFINQLPWENGSKMGLVLYNDTALVRSPLRQGEEQRRALLGLADRFRVNRGKGSLGFDAAIFQAYKQLPTQVEGEVNVIVAFDSGADPFSGVGAGCRQADRVGVMIAGIQIPEAGGRMGGCLNFSFSSAKNNDGDELESRFEEVGNALFKGDTIDAIIITDYLDGQYVEYIQGSSQPVRGVNVFGDDWEWELPGGRNPPGGRSLSYQLKVKSDDPGLAPAVTDFSYGADVFLRYASGIQVKLELDVPEQCLARAGKIDEDCFGWTPPTATPTPTDEPQPTDPPTETPVPGSETATPVPSETPVPPTETPTPDVTETPTMEPTEAPTDPPTATDTAEPPPPPDGIFLPFLARSYTVEG